MSIRASIQIRGSLVDVYRPVRAENSDGSTGVSSWLREMSETRVLLQQQSTAIAQKPHGQESEASYTGFALPDCELEDGDGIEVIRGLHSGERLIVRGSPLLRGSSLQLGHYELQLEKTQEKFH